MTPPTLISSDDDDDDDDDVLVVVLLVLELVLVAGITTNAQVGVARTTVAMTIRQK